MIVRRQRSRILLVITLLVLIGLGTFRAGWFAWGSYHLRAAHQALARRDFAAARERLACCVRAWPGQADTVLLAAQTARRDGALDEADRLLREARQVGALPEAVDMERQLLRLQAGDLDEADRYLSFCSAHPENPQMPLILEALITGALARRDLPRAQRGVALWMAQRQEGAERVQGLLWRGDVAIRGGDLDPALADFRAALALDPGHEGARLRLAELLTRHAPREALELLEPLERQRPGDRTVCLLLARCRRSLGELDEAARLLDALLAESPNNLDALLERGQVALDLRQAEQAEGWLRRAEALAPNRRDPNLALARCLQLAGKEEEARQYQERVARIDTDLRRRAGRKPAQAP